MPRLGHPRITDAVIRAFASTVQRASRLCTLDLPPTPPTTPSAREARFVDDFDAQCAVALAGTTARVIETPRERVAYWSLDLLIVLCSRASCRREAGLIIQRRPESRSAWLDLRCRACCRDAAP